jgi:hypothetical protein
MKLRQFLRENSTPDWRKKRSKDGLKSSVALTKVGRSNRKRLERINRRATRRSVKMNEASVDAKKKAGADVGSAMRMSYIIPAATGFRTMSLELTAMKPIARFARKKPMTPQLNSYR